MNSLVINKKEIESLVTRTRHTIYIKLNSTPDQIINILSNIPNNTKVSMIIGDSEDESGVGEIIFDEERISN